MITQTGVRIVLVLRAGQLCPLIEAETDIRVGSTATDLLTAQTPTAMDRDLKNASCGIEGLSG